MMSNLFIVFDPTSYFGVSLNWFIMLMVFMFIPMKYYLISSSYYNLYMYIIYSIKKMFSEAAFPNHSALIFMSMVVFLYLVLGNLLGMFPFIFTFSTHLKIILGFGFVLWMSFFLMGWIKNFMYSMAHLVPEGSPLILSPLMVIIESISHLIRPFTLSIRMVANMMAGHLIIGLLSSISMINFSNFLFSLMFQSMLLILEFGVAVIQGYVFSILLLLYALDYY